MRNPDGYQNFTAAQQPYHFYDTILQPQEITRPKRWEFHVPRTVARFGFTIRVFTSTPRERRVTLRAPEGRPKWFYVPSNSVHCSGLMAGSCLPDVVTIEFEGTSTLEERQSAIDHIEGEVVDGTTGAYHVRIPRDVTLSRMRKSLELLRRLPQVRYSAPFSTAVGTVDYLQSYDAAEWRAWRMDPDSADGQNWALEQINAPLAWGCERGDSATVVGVVDDGFFSVSDLVKQKKIATHGYPSAGSTLDDHATRVTSVVAAFGNDTSQITGVMWRAGLVLRDVAVDSAGNRHLPGQPGFPLDELWPQVEAAARSGARVINLSVGFPWASNPALEPDTIKQAENAWLVRAWFGGFRRTMDSLAADGIRPLIVFSAGNQGVLGVDTRWNVARIAADSADQYGQPYNVLTVGATTRHQALASFTSRDSSGLIHIAAPGQSVTVIHGDARVNSMDLSRTPPYGTLTGSGTSFAAPLVTGVAGLLFAFDPRLTAREVRSLIIEGAIRGQRSAGGIPILNAYESLKLAAQRPGTRLCGNRMWSDGPALVAQRRNGPETLYRLPSTSHYIRRFDAMHSGKRVRLLTRETGGQYLSELTYQSPAGTWQRSAPVRRDSTLWPVEGSGGGFNSTHRTPGQNFGYVSLYSHGGDTVVQLRTVPDANGYAAGATLTLVHAGGTRELDPIPAPVSVGANYATECWIRRTDTDDCMEYVNYNYVYKSRQMEWTGAYSPLGDSLYIVWRVLLSGGWMDPWEACPVAPAGDTIKDGVPDEVVRLCRPRVSGSGIDSTFHYVVDIRTGRSRLVRARTESLRILGMTEDGREFLVHEQDGNTSLQWFFYLLKPSPDATYYEMRKHFRDRPSTLQCSLQYRSTETGFTSFVAIAPRPDCTTDVDAQGAPYRAPDTR